MGLAIRNYFDQQIPSDRYPHGRLPTAEGSEIQPAAIPANAHAADRGTNTERVEAT
jgi:hypothetical protein